MRPSEAQENTRKDCTTCRFRVRKPEKELIKPHAGMGLGELKARDEWKKDQQGRREKETLRVNLIIKRGPKYSFDYEPSFFDWCAYHTVGLEISGAVGEIRSTGEKKSFFIICDTVNNGITHICDSWQARPEEWPAQRIFWADDSLEDARKYITAAREYKKPELFGSTSSQAGPVGSDGDGEEFSL